MSFYRLPHPWDPNYAIPRYVMAEPPERGVFVTNWLPRGTIPQLLPDYLASPVRTVEGSPSDDLGSLGGGCFGGSSLQGTCFDGDSLGAQRYALQPLGASGDIVTYGQKAAKAIIGHASKLSSPQQRAKALNQAMTKIDPSLPARAAKHVAAARKAGMPPAAALQHGLATAVSQGMVGELQKLGKSRVKPQPSSLLGLGLSRQQALGALSFADQAAAAPLMTYAASTTFVPPAATATAPMVCTGFSWVTDHWERTKVGGVDVPGPMAAPGAACSIVVSDVAGSGKVSGKYIQIGPFTFPADSEKTATVHLTDPSQIPASWATFIKPALLRGAGPSGPLRPGMYSPTTWWFNPDKTVHFRSPNEVVKDLCYWFAGLGIQCGTMVGQTIGAKGYPVGGSVVGGTMPIAMEMLATSVPTWQELAGQGTPVIAPVAMFTNAATNEPWGVFLVFGFNKNDPTTAAGGAGQRDLTITFAKVDQKPWYESVKSALTWLPNKLIDTVTDIVGTVAGLTCDLLASPGGVAGATAAGGPAAGAGAQIAGKLCSGGAPPPQMPVSSGMGWILPVALGAGALVLVLALRQ